MKNILAVLALISLGGCATYAPAGALATQTKQGLVVDNNVKPAKQGRACMNSVLAMAAWGDASIAQAKANAGITKVATIDYSVDNILGIYGTYCTVVTGS